MTTNKSAENLRDSLHGFKSEKDELNLKINKASWESSDLYDKMVNFVGKNKSLFMERFREEGKAFGDHIPLQRAKEVFCDILTKSNVKFNEENIGQIMHFAQRSGYIDYRFLLENFRNRHRALVSHPL